LKNEAFYSERNIETHLGTTATSIDRAAKIVQTSAGESLAYDTLALATGARARTLTVAGADLDGVLYLRSLDDAIALKARAAQAQAIVVIGGGYIGLEVAAAVGASGKPVTVLEQQTRLLERVAGPLLSAHVEAVHRARGVQLVLGPRVSRIIGEAGRATGVECEGGTVYPCDLVLAAVGSVANVELAQAAGLAVAGGISVDLFTRTCDPAIHAAGDCALRPSSHAGGTFRYESVQNATDQAKAAGQAIAGQPTAYDALPWFWSEQGDMRIQMAGMPHRHDAFAVRGDPAEGKFSIFYFRDGMPLAIETVNKPAEHLAGRRLLVSGAAVTPAQVSDLSFDIGAAAGPAAKPPAR
jgi:3-phenylpropionate/trans-cinnamate dioxygenase ferredoxin reductase subunit